MFSGRELKIFIPAKYTCKMYGPLCTAPLRLNNVIYGRLVSIWSISNVIVIKNFCVTFCCVVARVSLLGALELVAFGHWGPVSAIRHTCIRINGSPSFGGPYFARPFHVGIVAVFSFYRGGPTTLFGQESTLFLPL